MKISEARLRHHIRTCRSAFRAARIHNAIMRWQWIGLWMLVPIYAEIMVCAFMDVTPEWAVVTFTAIGATVACSVFAAPVLWLKLPQVASFARYTFDAAMLQQRALGADEDVWASIAQLRNADDAPGQREVELAWRRLPRRQQLQIERGVEADLEEMLPDDVLERFA